MVFTLQRRSRAKPILVGITTVAEHSGAISPPLLTHGGDTRWRHDLYSHGRRRWIARTAHRGTSQTSQQWRLIKMSRLRSTCVCAIPCLVQALLLWAALTCAWTMPSTPSLMDAGTRSALLWGLRGHFSTQSLTVSPPHHRIPPLRPRRSDCWCCADSPRWPVVRCRVGRARAPAACRGGHPWWRAADA